MKRVLELIEEIRRDFPGDEFFSDFEDSCETNPLQLKYYKIYNKAFMTTSEESWLILKEKSQKQFLNHREGQRKQGFFDILNEAFAYEYLVELGCSNVEFVRGPGADLRFTKDNEISLCEVKTINISVDEIHRRYGGQVCDGSVHETLKSEFFEKFSSAVFKAEKQIENGGRSSLIYVIVHFDDFTKTFVDEYKTRLTEHFQNKFSRKIYIKIGLEGANHIFLNTR